MNRKLVLGVAVGLIASQLWAQEKAPKKIELKTDVDKAVYAMGVSAARTMRGQFETQGVAVDAETLLRGFRDGLGEGKLALTDEEMNAAMQAVDLQVAKRNSDEGEAFLAANKRKKDVTTLPSGLQFKIIKKGTGKLPTLRDVVTVHFRGRMLNGKEFDNTYPGKVPLTMPLAETIAGWKEALPMMPVGSKWELYVPSDLAFGPDGNARIPANATLVFEVELLDANKPEAAPRAKPQTLEDIK
jgi:FKBP-type peptidyl-prolyl cis-trans isomerase